jgi:YlmC/YmxH family sporulation protein
MMMVKASDIKSKEIININDGKRLGLVSDIEINMDTGNIDAIVLPGTGKLFGIFSKDNDIVINWSSIKKIGVDVILVDVSLY